ARGSSGPGARPDERPGSAALQAVSALSPTRPGPPSARRLRLEERRATEAGPVGHEPAEHAERAEPVGDAPPEVDRRGLGEIARGDGNVADAEAEVSGLGQELRVEHEVVGVLLEGHRLKHPAGIDPEAGVAVPEGLA